VEVFVNEVDCPMQIAVLLAEKFVFGCEYANDIRKRNSRVVKVNLTGLAIRSMSISFWIREIGMVVDLSNLGPESPVKTLLQI